MTLNSCSSLKEMSDKIKNEIMMENLIKQKMEKESYSDEDENKIENEDENETKITTIDKSKNNFWEEFNENKNRDKSKNVDYFYELQELCKNPLMWASCGYIMDMEIMALNYFKMHNYTLLNLEKDEYYDYILALRYGETHYGALKYVHKMRKNKH